MEVEADPLALLFLRIFTVLGLDDPVIGPSKQALRASCRAVRQRLAAGEYGRRSERIVLRLQQLEEVTSARTVHVFWPMLDRREVDLRPFIAWLYTLKKQIVLPVVVADETRREEYLEHRLFSGEEALVRSHLGIREPLHSEAVTVDQIDLVVAPALAADRSGNRLGYGRGHYDRFLRDVAAPIVVPLYQECVLEQIPRDAHDVPVDVLVTETEVIRTSARNQSQNGAV
ncbi:MAG TPA: 5-formyltetrahydrofolate cyclo-ligase [Rhodothermales bacterium]